VAVNTNITDPNAFLEHIITSTNMRCLTPRSALEGDCGFLAANLYARSVFGEDALVNVSVEKLPGSKLAGFIRIRCAAGRHGRARRARRATLAPMRARQTELPLARRSKTQGIALSLGDKLILRQKA
jgi:coatomer subunit beta